MGNGAVRARTGAPRWDADGAGDSLIYRTIVPAPEVKLENVCSNVCVHLSVRSSVELLVCN